MPGTKNLVILVPGKAQSSSKIDKNSSKTAEQIIHLWHSCCHNKSSAAGYLEKLYTATI